MLRSSGYIRVGLTTNTDLCTRLFSSELCSTMEPRYNESLRDWEKQVSLYRGFFHTLQYFWGERYRSLYRALRYVKIRYIEGPLQTTQRHSESWKGGGSAVASNSTLGLFCGTQPLFHSMWRVRLDLTTGMLYATLWVLLLVILRLRKNLGRISSPEYSQNLPRKM